MIEVRDVTKRYGSTRAVEDVSFTAPPGTVTGFLGPNGAGKTTTLRILLGLARPDAGSACIDGVRYAELASPRRTVGAVLDTMGFHPGRTGRNHLRVVARAAGLPQRRVDEVLGFVGLAAAADRRVGGYSHGMRQRLALAGALLGDPPVLVLDEPATGLDPAGMAWLRRLLGDWAGRGRTVLFSSHVLAEVEAVADRVVIIDRGRIVHEGTAAELSGALGAATGSLVRNQVAAIVGWLAWLFVVEHIAVGFLPSLGRWLPAAAGRALVRAPSEELLAQSTAAVVLAVYAAALMSIAVLSERYRDA